MPSTLLASFQPQLSLSMRFAQFPASFSADNGSHSFACNPPEIN
jgi:hypothetical protein